MSDDLVLRAGEPADTERICALLGAVFPDNPKARPEVYRWQYWDNPFGAPSVWVWEDAGEIVGHGGLYPVPGLLDGRRVLLGHAADAATAASHRGQGLYQRLNRLRYASAADRAMAVTMSLPNPDAWPGSAGAGLIRVGRVGAWVRPLDDAWLAERLRIPVMAAAVLRRAAFPSWRSASGGEPVEELPDGLGCLWERNRHWSPCGISRDDAWWRWRYGAHPDAPYAYAVMRRSGRLAAAAATRSVEGLLYVMDLLADDEDAAAGVLRAAVGGAGEAAGVVLVALPGTRLAQLAAAAGLRRLPRRLEPRPMLLGVVAGTEHDGDLALRPWTVSWGDHDHV
ncbi:MAG: GNAT family N-acetyltransferase [Egibacteraceae bacterium]